MIAPSLPLLFLLLVPAIGSLAVFFSDVAVLPILAMDGAIAAVALVDLASLPRRRRLRAQRECQGVASIHERHPVTLVVENRSGKGLRAEVQDDGLPGLEAQPRVTTLRLSPRSRSRVDYSLIASRRGMFPLEWVYVRATSRLGLWRRTYRLESKTELRVYPALGQIRRYALYARTNRLRLIGVRRSRRIGTDNEFERLREYNQDDSFKAIDWRATARRRRLMVRDFQSNHNQRVVFLVDAGRMMTSESGGLSMFDHALEAALTLAHVALVNSDHVGLMAFSDQILRWLKPGGGKRHLNRLVHSVHDLHPALVESRYDLAFLHLERHCRKRTLVVLVTNLIDDVNAEAVRSQLTNLVGRHLPLGVFLRDHELYDPAERGLASLSAPRDAPRGTLARARYHGAAAVDIIESRESHLRRLRHDGALVLDVFPEQLTASVINEYLRVKAKHLL